jgi:hypothetical protein
MQPRTQPGILRVVTSGTPTKLGTFRAFGFEHDPSNGSGRTETALALVLGDVTEDAALLRIHSQCFCKKHSLLTITVADPARFRLELDFETTFAAVEGLLPVSPKYTSIAARRFEPADLCLTGRGCPIEKPAKAGAQFN